MQGTRHPAAESGGVSAAQTASVPERAALSFRSMGTWMSLVAHGPDAHGPDAHGPDAHGPDAHGPDAHGALEAGKALIFDLEALLSKTLPGSDVSALNRSGGAWVDVHADTDAVLREALEAARRTGGAYDPAVGALVDLWDVKRRRASAPMPSAEQVRRAVRACGHHLVDRDGHGRYRLRGDATIDLGGIGKGYAADRVRDLLRRRGVTSALASLGGSSVAGVGARPDGSAWRVGLRAVDGGPAEYFGVVYLTDGFLSTSADYEQCSVRDGRRLHHILDLRTGWPADSDLRSVTVVADSGARSEALSTALLVMGLDAAMDLHRREGGFEAIVVTSEGRVLGTPGAPRIFRLRACGIGRVPTAWRDSLTAGQV